MEERNDGRMRGGLDGWMSRRVGVWNYVRMRGLVSGWQSECRSGRVIVLVDEWKDGWMSGRIDG